MEVEKPSKILVFGGTGYIGKYLVAASISMGHPTYVYARPFTPLATEANQKLRDHFRSIGVTLVEVKSSHLCTQSSETIVGILMD